MYALVLLGTAAAKNYLGNHGLFIVAVISGLTDMDAISLSISQMVSARQLDGGSGWRLIMTASLSNLVFKTAIVAILGSRQLLLRVCVLLSPLLSQLA